MPEVYGEPNPPPELGAPPAGGAVGEVGDEEPAPPKLDPLEEPKELVGPEAPPGVVPPGAPIPPVVEAEAGAPPSRFPCCC